MNTVAFYAVLMLMYSRLHAIHVKQHGFFFFVIVISLWFNWFHLQSWKLHVWFWIYRGKNPCPSARIFLQYKGFLSHLFKGPSSLKGENWALEACFISKQKPFWKILLLGWSWVRSFSPATIKWLLLSQKQGDIFYLKIKFILCFNFI